MKDDKKVCLGMQCSVRWQCKRYTHRNTCAAHDYGIMLKCTNQKKFVQDVDNIVKGR